ncbi:hypothetical protein J2Y45_005297 [Dyadobacter sp. BE34]|uniref:DUF695 domain-containing protein n=1 Tax=Dyadobacter fermentans TaxID=94254 RepID=A0ABU1R4L3_9BACT|nr:MULTISPECIES: hypothetical protein [Dyadobacter]MDR6808353.1 hypothetical protein [Dyadobacter fermentans]MDR7045830.1 hypothetical protein [Dyadobacter sp. BE242]MDR7200143.1 hypothetical protein [Dyadobacter sp. BE34]MDR7218103.1 hypothetical protein [Dyadobacter sp. BE31]MDR7266034.1 hypothetical protein [Dyadobacter sp. BE32]
MDLEFYPFYADDDRLYFDFLSVSPERTIRKAVIFTPLSAHEVFNLALVDVRPDGSICDKTISNNGDLEKVMATVFQCVAQFFESYPWADIYLQANTPARNRLYRIIISKELSRIKKYYEIYGTIDSVTETFEPGKEYHHYIIKSISI